MVWPASSRRRLLCCLLGAMWLASGAAPEVFARDTLSDTWTGADALGRAAPGADECGAPRQRFVGIFYFLWLEGPKDASVYDISRILAGNPAAPKWGPPGAFHWWGQPHLGYYRGDDPYVIREHAQMLCDAGVDVIIFDVTNELTYDATFLKICQVYAQIRKEGGRTPQIAFLTHSGADKVVRHLYDTFYAKRLYPELWFMWKGKPLIVSSPAGLEPPIAGFFTFRESWAWTAGQAWFGDGRDKWPWLDHSPQNFGWHDDPKRPEQMCVCVAEHPVTNIGRSFHDGHEPPAAAQHPEAGAFFGEQWKRALQVDPEFIFVTGWNEWIAMRFIAETDDERLAGRRLKRGDTFFVDTYSEEFSRDIEPMRGGHGDDYYYQLAANIRRYKGSRPAPAPSSAKTISPAGGFEQWADVKPEYLDDLFDTTHRDHPGFAAGSRLTDDAGRNDFDAMKVARDEKNIYFYARTREPITAPEGEQWMQLLIDADADPRTGWLGYDYVINRRRPAPGVCTLERFEHGNWADAGTASLRVAGREMQIAVPRAVLGLAGKPVKLDFKWADNVPALGDGGDFIDHGDVAPNGRFNYRFSE